MRTIILVACMCSASFAWAEDSVEINPPVRLNTPADLANLRATNPTHYARAQRIIADAKELCRPGQPTLQSTELKSGPMKCGHLFLTSNPPKREISFTLDRTNYVALVTVTADPPKPARIE
jgi:hypothetical protein